MHDWAEVGWGLVQSTMTQIDRPDLQPRAAQKNLETSHDLPVLDLWPDHVVEEVPHCGEAAHQGAH